MNPSIVQSQIAMFYSLLEAAAKDQRLGGVIGPSLFSFFHRPEIKTRFTAAPASTALRFHHAFDGGLVAHTVEVFRIAQITAGALGELVNDPQSLTGWRFTSTPAGFLPYIDLLAAVALHDLNKIGDAFGLPYFEPNMIKNGTVRSDKIPYASSEKIGKFATQAGPSSPAPIVQGLYLGEEAMEWAPDGVHSLSVVRAVDPMLFGLLNDGIKFAIVHHDGAYGKGRRKLVGNETPLQMVMHFADMWSRRMNKEEYRG